jgi:preprotein translocase subunit YajC
MNNLSFFIAATTTTTKSSASSSSSSLFLVVIIGLVAAFYFLMIRPNQRRRMQAMRESRAFDLGDEVVAGGMVGHVVRIGDSDVDVEVSDGVVITFVKQAVQARASYTPPGARGLGAGGGLGGGGAYRGSGVNPRPASAGGDSRQSNSHSEAWPEDDDGTDAEESSDGASGANARGASSGGDVSESGGESGVEPSGEER